MAICFNCFTYFFIKIDIFPKTIFCLMQNNASDFIMVQLSLFSISQSDTFNSSVFKLSPSLKYVFFVKVLYSIVSSSKLRTLRLVLFCSHLVFIRNNNVPYTEPRVTKTSVFSQVDSNPPQLTNCFFPSRYELVSRCLFPLKP